MVARLRLSVSVCIFLNFGSASDIRIAIIAIMISSVTPVASVHSSPFPAIFVIAQTAMIGAFTIICKPIVMNS